MEISNDLQDKLRAYVQGSLSPKEVIALDDLMTDRPGLKAELDFVEQLVDGAEAVERDRLLAMVEDTLEEEGDINKTQEEPKNNWRSRWFIIGLLTLAFAMFWYFSKKDAPKTTPSSQTQITVPIAKALIQKNHLDNGALEQSLLKPFNTLSTTEDDIRDIKTLLANHQYAEAINLIQTFSKEHPHFGRMQLIYGYCLLQQEKPSEAFEKFDLVQQSSSNIYLQEEAEWLKALTLILKEEEKTAIQAALKRILENENHSYHMEAVELYQRF